MLIAWSNKTFSSHIMDENNADLLKETIWIDMIKPSKSEEALVEKYLGFNIPTRDEMQEIEISSRLYRANNALFLTAQMLANANSPDPEFEAVTFILTKNQLISLRYIEPSAFKSFIRHLPQNKHDYKTALFLLLGLLEATIDRLADILELLGRNLDNYSRKILKSHTEKKSNYIRFLQHIGRNADLHAKVEESLFTFNRLVTFLEESDECINYNHQLLSRLSIINKDIDSLITQTGLINNKMVFLLDATLGLVHIEQNSIIKIFSVAAVIFLPPTLIASIYGMNFHFMPELSWKYGYIIAIFLMLLAAWLPYKYFKYKKWL